MVKIVVMEILLYQIRIRKSVGHVVRSRSRESILMRQQRSIGINILLVVFFVHTIMKRNCVKTARVLFKKLSSAVRESMISVNWLFDVTFDDLLVMDLVNLETVRARQSIVMVINLHVKTS